MAGYIEELHKQAARDVAHLPPLRPVSAKDFTPEMAEERAREMERLYRDDDYPRSMAEVGIIFGLTRERVRQIFATYGIKTRTKVEAKESQRTRYAKYGSDHEEAL